MFCFVLLLIFFQLFYISPNRNYFKIIFILYNSIFGQFGIKRNETKWNETVEYRSSVQGWFMFVHFERLFTLCVNLHATKIDCIQMVNIPSNNDLEFIMTHLKWVDIYGAHLSSVYRFNLYWTLNVRMLLQSKRQLFGNNDFDVIIKMNISSVIVRLNFNIVWTNSPYCSSERSDGDRIFDHMFDGLP